MVPLFVGYALIVWYFAAKYRRDWLGLGAVALGVLGLLIINYAHWRIGRWAAMRDPVGRGIMLPVLQTLMYPYTALVGLLGLFIVSMPRTHRTGCFRCGYDITGLELSRCPECGMLIEQATRPSGTPRGDLRQSDVPGEQAAGGSPEDEPGHHAEPQDSGGQTEQQRPPEGGEL